jgi:hypothetical protein
MRRVHQGEKLHWMAIGIQSLVATSNNDLV